MCNCKKTCLKCKKKFSKELLYYHKHYDKYYKTYWCEQCLIKKLDMGIKPKI